MKEKPVLRLLAWGMALALLFACAGCGGNEPNDPSDVSQTEPASDTVQIRYNDLRLAYARGDKLDPFLCKTTVNRQLTTLMYDSLFTVDEHFEAKPLLAKEYSTDGLSVTVSVNTDVRFTDGTYMTPADVIYSFELAKESDAYKARLKNFDSASAVGTNVLLFTLASPDPYAVACLDFPIVKTGTSAQDRKKAAEELPEEDAPKTTDQMLPVGSGRYVLQYEENENDPVLVAFNDRFRGFYPPMSLIRSFRREIYARQRDHLRVSDEQSRLSRHEPGRCGAGKSGRASGDRCRHRPAGHPERGVSGTRDGDADAVQSGLDACRGV